MTTEDHNPIVVKQYGLIYTFFSQIFKILFKIVYIIIRVPLFRYVTIIIVFLSLYIYVMNSIV